MLSDRQTDRRKEELTDTYEDAKSPLRNYVKELKVLLKYRLFNLGMKRIFYNSFL